VSVGWGVVKNVAIVLAIDRPSLGLEAEFRGSGDVPLQEVRILVFVMFTKQPRAALLVLSVLQKIFCKPSRYVLYKCTYIPYDGTFGASDQGQTLDV
jgi:hypothetical protein